MTHTSKLTVLVILTFVITPFTPANAAACSNGLPAGVEIEVGAGESSTFYVAESGLWQESNGVFVGGDIMQDLQDGCRGDPTLPPDTRLY